MRDLDSFLIPVDASITDAMRQVESNHSRCVFVHDQDQKVVGIATDGDIRRSLLKSPDMSAPIESCMNSEFVRAEENSPREYVLKLLDHNVQVVPILDKNGCLVDLVTSQYFPLERQKNIAVRARSPVRISFGGGGTDLTHYFVENDVGAVMNATIKMYSHALLKKRDDNKIVIQSMDLDASVELNSLSELSSHSEFALISSVLELIQPDFGFELSISSDFPVGSGLGGSAVVLSAIIGCFNQFREDPWARHEIAELAFQAERIFLKMQGGWQDQYATVYGSFNFIEFKESENLVYPLRINRETLLELEGNLILCDTKQAHVSGDVHSEQKKEFQASEAIQNLVHKNKNLCYKMKSLLLKGQLNEFGRSLGEAWRLKREFGKSISNKKLDDIYEVAIGSGALGGKLLGAGGGGFFLFYILPENRNKLIQNLEKLGLGTRPVHFDKDGLQVWTVREE